MPNDDARQWVCSYFLTPPLRVIATTPQRPNVTNTHTLTTIDGQRDKGQLCFFRQEPIFFFMGELVFSLRHPFSSRRFFPVLQTPSFELQCRQYFKHSTQDATILSFCDPSIFRQWPSQSHVTLPDSLCLTVLSEKWQELSIALFVSESSDA